jgi:hypothetical protein
MSTPGAPPPDPRPSDAEVSERYLRLALRLGRLDEGVIDAYFGAAGIAQAVDDEPEPDPAALVADAEDLLAELPDGWLHDQVVGLRTVAGRLAGEQIAYHDEVEACYGVRPVYTEAAALDSAYDELERLLPGPGSLHERFRAWEDSAQVPATTIEALMAAVVEEARARTRDLFGLPDGESIELEYVRDTPWLGYHEYLGDLRGRISVNVDRPRSAISLLHLALHESYAGHQAERCNKEMSLVRGRGLREETVAVVTAPQSVVSEGLAELAVELMLDGPTGSAFEAVVHDHDVELDLTHARAVARATEPLGWLGVDAALMLHQEGRPPAEVSAYLADRHMITSDAADRWVRFLSAPGSRSYAVCYPAGLELCRAFVAGKPTRFRTLLTEQVRVGDLTAAAL